MNLRKNYTIKTTLFFLFLIGFSSAHAETRGTPTIVTNDSSSPVAVTGTVIATNPNFYKAIGATTATTAGNKTGYAMGVMCATEYPGSRACSSEELILDPGRVTVGPSGAWIRPIIVAFYGSTLYDYSKKDASGSYGLALINGDIERLPWSTERPVLCCAP